MVYCVNLHMFASPADYRLVIICSNEEEEKSYFISKLHLFKRPYVTQKDVVEIKYYLLNHFTKQVQKSGKSSYDVANMASVVDCIKYVHYDIIIIFFS